MKKTTESLKRTLRFFSELINGECTKYKDYLDIKPRLGGLNNKNLFSHNSGSWVDFLKSTRVDFLWGLSPWLADSHPLAASSHSCSSVHANPGVSLWVLVSSLDTSQIGLGSILRSSFYLNYFFFYCFLIGGKLLCNAVLITSLKASSPNTVTFWDIWSWGSNIGIWREHSSYHNLGEKERLVALWLV